jgi:uncharacterized protein (DUF1015 family)
VQDEQPCFYLYRQIMNGHSQVGLVAAASCAEYDDGLIKKHELTRPDKETDRVRHMKALNSQTGPVFLTYRAEPEIDAFVERITACEPAIDFTANDGVRHATWTLDADADIAFIAEQFAAIESLYIADGHHRSAAALRVCAARNGAGHSGQFLTVIFPHNQIQILAYNRAMKDLNDRDEAAFILELEKVFEISGEGSGECAAKNELGLYLGGQWRRLLFKPSVAATERLDVTLLQNHVLGPLLGVEDPRTNDRIAFIGGIRGAAELERLVDSGECACAFSLFPTGIDDLMAIADADELMPPKSTWFEPKLRDGLFCHMI